MSPRHPPYRAATSRRPATPKTSGPLDNDPRRLALWRGDGPNSGEFQELQLAWAKNGVDLEQKGIGGAGDGVINRSRTAGPVEFENGPARSSAPGVFGHCRDYFPTLGGERVTCFVSSVPPLVAAVIAGCDCTSSAFRFSSRGRQGRGNAGENVEFETPGLFSHLAAQNGPKAALRLGPGGLAAQNGEIPEDEGLERVDDRAHASSKALISGNPSACCRRWSQIVPAGRGGGGRARCPAAARKQTGDRGDLRCATDRKPCAPGRIRPRAAPVRSNVDDPHSTAVRGRCHEGLAISARS